MIKYARIEEILEIKESAEQIPQATEPGQALTKFASLSSREDNDGYLYVRCRAISSRVNKNNDGWPSKELANSYKSFFNRPIFVDHNNDNPDRTRGVIVDSRLHVEDEKNSAFDAYYSTAPDNHKPPTWIELLLEVDAKTFPKLAEAVRKNKIDAVSMGANIERSTCSVCGHEARTPQEYCSHVNSKGAEFEILADNGEKITKKAYEDCSDITFFEISFVFDPADPTALISEKKGKVANSCPSCNSSNVDKVLKEEWDNDNLYSCLDCNKNYRKQAGPYGIGDPGDEEDEPEFDDSVQPGQMGEEYYLPGARDPFAQPDKGQELDQWRMQTIFEMLIDHGADPNWAGSTAKELAARSYGLNKFDYRELETLLNRGWPAEQAVQTLSKASAWKIVSMPGDVPREGEPHIEEHDRQLNYEPQSEAVTSPQEVDTLKKDHPCPNCKSDNLRSDPDGLMKCPTCQFTQPPKPLDNPDLSAHDRVDEEQPQETSGEDDILSQIRISPREEENSVEPVQGVSPIKSSITNKEINRMEWTTVYNGASVDTFITNPNGITSDTYKVLKENNLVAKVTYPTGESTNIPFDNPVKDMVLALKAQKLADLNDPSEVPIVVQTSLKDVDTVLEAIHTGKVKPVKKLLNPSTITKTDDPKNVRVVSDQLAPVKSNEMEKDADRKKIKRQEEEVDGGVVRTEEIIEETEGSISDETKESKADEEGKLLLAFALADDLVSLGLKEPEEKFAFIAELENDSIEEIKAKKAMVELVKESGLRKPVAKVAGLSRLPKISSFEVESNNGNDDIPFEAIFF